MQSLFNEPKEPRPFEHHSTPELRQIIKDTQLYNGDMNSKFIKDVQEELNKRLPKMEQPPLLQTSLSLKSPEVEVDKKVKPSKSTVFIVFSNKNSLFGIFTTEKKAKNSCRNKKFYYIKAKLDSKIDNRKIKK